MHKSGKSLAVAGLIGLTVALSVMTTRPVEAQGGAKATDVRVINTPFVQQVPNRVPYTQSTWTLVPAGEYSAMGTGNNLQTVPVGKVLVIETIHIFTQVQDFTHLSLITSTESMAYGFFGPGQLANGIYTNTQPVMARIPGGTSFNVRATCSGNQGNRTIYYVLNGYLELAP